ncbi:acyl-CoA dehydrogenase family protein [Pseudonocardia ailaonensis]|uniref:Acyl-CoA dehydrogenase family protein n=2 Tax=Pseudonocardia ailaonensis TaxID=367279 RepID=A0ABN2N9Q1_9PSEU
MCPPERARGIVESEGGVDPTLWAALSDRGLLGLVVPGELGGPGRDLHSLAAVQVELGRTLVPVPFMATAVLASEALLKADDVRVSSRLLPLLAAGRTTATLAFAGEVLTSEGDWAPAPVAATQDGDRWALEGRAHFVLDGMNANVVLVVADSQQGPSLYIVEGDGARQIRRSPLHVADRTRRLADLEFRSVAAQPVGVPGQGRHILDAALDLAALALAAEHVGGMLAVLETAVGHACEREQFGRPVGTFQAVQTLCVDTLIDLEVARVALDHAVRCMQDGRDHTTGDADNGPTAVALAAACCAEAYSRCAARAAQVQGGSGFLWTGSAHLHIRRASAGVRLFGTPAKWRARATAGGRSLPISADHVGA